MLTAVTERAPSTRLAEEDTVLRTIYGLLAVLFSFAVPAQALDSSIVLDCLDAEPSMPAQILANEPRVEKLDEFADEVDDVAVTGPNNTVHVPIEAIKSSDEMLSMDYSRLDDDKLTVNHTTEQSTMLPQIVATEPVIEKFCEAFDDMADVPIGIRNAADVVVRLSPPSDSE